MSSQKCLAWYLDSVCMLSTFCEFDENHKPSQKAVSVILFDYEVKQKNSQAVLLLTVSDYLADHKSSQIGQKLLSSSARKAQVPT